MSASKRMHYATCFVADKVGNSKGNNIAPWHPKVDRTETESNELKPFLILKVHNMHDLLS